MTRLGRFVALDRVVDFLSMNGNVSRCLDAQPYLVATNLDDGDHDVVADHDFLIEFSRENEHG